MAIEICEHDGLVEFVGHGELTAVDILAVSQEYHSRTPRKLALWNLREVRMSSCRAENFPVVAGKGAELAALRGPGARNAILVGNEDERLLMLAYVNTASAVSPIEHRAFTNRDEAIAWLTGVAQELIAGDD